MTTIQSCNDCAKQSTCPKAANFENYSFDRCMDFVEKNKTEDDDETSI